MTTDYVVVSIRQVYGNSKPPSWFVLDRFFVQPRSTQWNSQFAFKYIVDKLDKRGDFRSSFTERYLRSTPFELSKVSHFHVSFYPVESVSEYFFFFLLLCFMMRMCDYVRHFPNFLVQTLFSIHKWNGILLLCIWTGMNLSQNRIVLDYNSTLNIFYIILIDR